MNVPLTMIDCMLRVSVTAVMCTNERTGQENEKNGEDGERTVNFPIRIRRVRLVECEEFAFEIYV